MTLIPLATAGIGLALLAHACYSAQEYSAQASKSLSSSPVPTAATSGILSSAHNTPIDIVLEAITATFLVCLALALRTPSLRPIRWSAWAGKVEREGSSGFASRGDDGKGALVGNPFRMLEARPGFVDIRRQRTDFAQWVREGNTAGS